MIFFVVFGILGFVVSSALRKKWGYHPWELLLAPFLLAVSVSSFTADQILQGYVPVKLTRTEYKLSAMRTGEGVKGSFVIGSGVIGSSMKFQMYVVNNDGSVSPMEIAADSRVILVEDRDLENVGYLTVTVKKCDYSTAIANWVWRNSHWEELVSYELRVPVGAVLHDFVAQ